MKAFVAVCMISVAAAKEKLRLSENGISRTHPIVEAPPCQVCLVSTSDTQACLGYSANAVLGWKWEQQFYDNTQTTEIIDGYYDLKFKIYTQLAAELEALAALSQWFKIQINGTFQPFKLGGYA